MTTLDQALKKNKKLAEQLHQSRKVVDFLKYVINKNAISLPKSEVTDLKKEDNTG